MKTPPKKKILLVDDEMDLVAELSLRLEASGWEILTAYDGQEGLEKAQQKQPDLILLDIAMPKISGYQVCRELKEGLVTNKIPIIMLTSKTQEFDKQWGKECGADDYLTKPCEIDVLLKKIGELLG